MGKRGEAEIFDTMRARLTVADLERRLRESDESAATMWAEMNDGVATQQLRAERAEAEVGRVRDALESVLPTDPATANYQEETWCYWCHGDEDPDRYGCDPSVLQHTDDCAWTAARAVLGEGNDGEV